tara:strand:- start:6845 stop:9310 length:2466 start_codon:yes stop_codon:yes gene_type:complete
MDNTTWNEVNSTLDLNGPILSYSEQPTGATGIGTTTNSTGGGSVSFTGISTGVDPGTGYLSYEWYEQDVGKLSDSTYVTGAASTGPVGTAATLTISNLITPTDNQRKFYLVTDYVASAYGTGKSTGNAWNEPLTSGIATATVNPLIEIVAQPPEGVQTLINATPNEFVTGQYSSISVNADLTDSYFADDLTYQWYLNGELAEDGVKTVTTTTSATVSGTVENTYTSNATYTTPSSATDIVITVAGAAGGHGGADGGGPGGNSGSGRIGRFSFIDDGETALDFRIGGRGNDGTSGGQNAGGGWGASNLGASGGNGGGAGNVGWSGGGGGGGGACVVKYTSGSPIIVAGGGGGGGGGSHNVGGENGDNAQGWTVTAGNTSVGLVDGGNGQTKSGDGGGGGGGGGGAGSSQVSGGSAGQDNQSGGEGGSGGRSQYVGEKVTLQSNWLGGGGDSAYVNLKYTGYTSTLVSVTTKTSISGAQSNTLKIASDSVGVQTCQCKITSATASNSPIWTDVSNFVTTSTADQYDINIENIGIGITASLSNINLANGDYTFYTSQSQVSSGGITKYFSFYAPDKDIDVEMDLYGGKGDDKSSYTGGEGGYSRIRFTMKQNEEYVISGLSTDSVNTPFVYRQGELMACVGQGGAAGKAGKGGSGGGVLNAGQDGTGMNSGNGGVGILEGTLGSNGIFGSLYPSSLIYPGDASGSGFDGGRTIRCTKGVYWAQQGIGACDDMPGTNVFRLSNGSAVTNTALITRGFKSGYNIMETAGDKDGNGGVGGNGATGGQGASEGGGGGGGGYSDGTITVVDTQQGGSTGNAKVILRVVT